MTSLFAVGVGVAAAAFFVRHLLNPEPPPFSIKSFGVLITVSSQGKSRTSSAEKISRRRLGALGVGKSILQGGVRAEDES